MWLIKGMKNNHIRCNPHFIAGRHSREPQTLVSILENCVAVFVILCAALIKTGFRGRKV